LGSDLTKSIRHNTELEHETIALIELTKYLVIFSGVTVISTATYFGLHLYQQRRESLRRLLIERFNTFNEHESKLGREKIVNAKYTPEGDFAGTHEDHKLFKKELGVLDTTANLVKHGDLSKKRFLQLLAAVIIVNYESAKPYIDFVRKKRETEYYAFYFQWLYDEAGKWWEKNRKVESGKWWKKNRKVEPRPTRDGI